MIPDEIYEQQREMIFFPSNRDMWATEYVVNLSVT